MGAKVRPVQKIFELELSQVKVLVPVKSVVDYNVKVRVRSDGSGVEINNVKMGMNPFDEIAVEEAVRLREATKANEVVVVSIGSNKSKDTLRTALAMGADRAILIEADDGLEPLAVAKLLAALVAEETPKLIVMGKQAIDDDCNQTGQMLASLLGWAQGTFASSLSFEGDRVVVEREVDGGLQAVSFALPGVVTADLRLNEPRYASLPNIMKAKKKPLDVRAASDFGVDVLPRLKVLRVEEPPQRKAGVMVSSVAELVERLGSEAGVI